MAVVSSNILRSCFQVHLGHPRTYPEPQVCTRIEVLSALQLSGLIRTRQINMFYSPPKGCRAQATHHKQVLRRKVGDLNKHLASLVRANGNQVQLDTPEEHQGQEGLNT